MAKEAFKKGRRFCIFCGKPGMSKEHLWPEWAHGLLPGDDPTVGRSGHTRHRYLGPQIHPIRRDNVIERQGAPKTIKLNVVCHRCNNGWMSKAEEDVRRWLEPMLQSEAVELDAAGQRILAEYFMMKVFVSDQSIEDWTIFTADERRAFYDDRTIPRGAIVAVFRYEDPPNPWVATYNKESARANSAIVNRAIIPANFTFWFRPVFVQILFFRKAEAKIVHNDRFGFTIFPQQRETVFWPPPDKLNIREAQRIQHGLEASGVL